MRQLGALGRISTSAAFWSVVLRSCEYVVQNHRTKKVIQEGMVGKKMNKGP